MKLPFYVSIATALSLVGGCVSSSTNGDVIPAEEIDKEIVASGEAVEIAEEIVVEEATEVAAESEAEVVTPPLDIDDAEEVVVEEVVEEATEEVAAEEPKKSFWQRLFGSDDEEAVEEVAEEAVAAEEVVTEEPVVEEPAEVVVEEVVVEEAAEEVAVEEPKKSWWQRLFGGDDEEAVEEAVAAEEVVTEEPVVEEPAEEVAVEEPVVEEPAEVVVEEVVVEEAAEEVAVEEPKKSWWQRLFGGDDEEAVEEVAEEAVAVEEVVTEEPVVEEPAEEVAVEEPVVEEPAEEVAVEEPVVEEPKEEVVPEPAVVAMTKDQAVDLMDAIERVYFAALTAETIEDVKAARAYMVSIQKVYADKCVLPDGAVASLDKLANLLNVEEAIWETLALTTPGNVKEIKSLIKNAPVRPEHGVGIYGLLYTRGRQVTQSAAQFLAREQGKFVEASKDFFKEAKAWNAAVEGNNDRMNAWISDLNKYKECIVKRVSGDRAVILEWWDARVARNNKKDYVAGYRLWNNALNGYAAGTISTKESDRVQLYWKNAHEIYNISKTVDCPADREKLLYMSADLTQRALNTWTRNGRFTNRKEVDKMGSAAIKFWNSYAECLPSADPEVMEYSMNACFLAGDYTRAATIADKLAPAKADNRDFLYTYAHMLCLTGRVDDAVEVFEEIAQNPDWIDFSEIQTSVRYVRAWQDRPEAMAKMFLPSIRLTYDRCMVGENKIVIQNRSNFPLTNFTIVFNVEGRLMGEHQIDIPSIPANSSVSYDAIMSMYELRNKTEIRWECDQIKAHKELVK